MFDPIAIVSLISSKVVPIIGVIAVILVLVVAHELGHFLAAKASGMRVEEFAVGFGTKKLTVFKSGPTEYNIRPIPAGGFVRIAGMDPSEESPPDGFLAQSVWKRMGVIFAGPFASFLFAYLLFCSLGMTYGLPVGTPVVETVQRGSPAAEVGLQSGDRFVSIAGDPINTAEDMFTAIQTRPGQEIEVVVDRDGETLTFHPTTLADEEGGQTIGRLGFVPGADVQRFGFVASVKEGTNISIRFLGQFAAVITSPSRLAREAGGPLAIIDATHQAAKSGMERLIILTAILSLNFAILNLLPIPILDGGHLLLLGIEVVRRRRLSEKTHQVAAIIGLAMLATIIILVMAKDITRLFF